LAFLRIVANLSLAGATVVLRERFRSPVAPKSPLAHTLVGQYSGGMTRFTAVIRIKRDRKIIHREAGTFSQRGAAEKWVKHREVSLQEPNTVAREQAGAPKLRQPIRWFIDNFSIVSK
jgi:hypothetical protein